MNSIDQADLDAVLSNCEGKKFIELFGALIKLSGIPVSTLSLKLHRQKSFIPKAIVNGYLL